MQFVGVNVEKMVDEAEDKEEEVVVAEPVASSIMTPGQQYAVNRTLCEQQVKFHTGGTPFKALPAKNKPSTPEVLFHHRQKLFCDVDPNIAQQDSQVDDGFQDTQDCCPFSQDEYYNY